MDKWLWCLIGLLLVTSPSLAFQGDAAASPPSRSVRALSDARRPAKQATLDAARKPAELIDFAGLKSGDRVADFMSGNAYFTRIFSNVVGASGHVYAFVPAEQVANCSPSEIAGTKEVGRDSSYANVTVLTDSVANFRVPTKLDVLWTAQNYHDLHDSFMGPADVGALNRKFFEALKPGGVFVVIDHVAEAGSGLRDTDTLHRIDPERIRKEVEAAGFVLEAQSSVLRNSEDDHRRIVFDPIVRGKTDQIVFKFRKPR
jgi:predicted methyltransferase